jgi:hypothetical protein
LVCEGEGLLLPVSLSPIYEEKLKDADEKLAMQFEKLKEVITQV